MTAPEAQAETAAAPAAPEYELEAGRRLSESMIWTLQKNFYDRMGVSAWSDGIIPSYITSNPYIARAYARLILAYLRDCHTAREPLARLDPAQPVHIVEMAAGSGRFSYYLLKKLQALVQALALPGLTFRYVMTDFTENNIRFWREHPAFQPFLQQGMLDFARYEIGCDQELKLLESGATLAADGASRPMVLVANYIFDAVPHDLYRVRDGQLEAARVAHLSGQPEPDLSDPGILERVRRRYTYEPVDADVYDDPAANQVLQAYAARLGNTSFLMPVGALRCVRNFLDLSGGRLMVLAGDKGYNFEDELVNLDEPYVALHGASFSMMVNFHALRQYFQLRGGWALQTSQRQASLKVSAFVAGGPPAAYPDTRLTFQEDIENFGPVDFFSLSRATAKDSDTPSLEHVLELLRLSDWDPSILMQFRDVVATQLQSASDGALRELRQTIDRVWDNYYRLRDRTDVPFELARLLFAMQRPQEALRYNQESVRLFGEHHITLYNMGLCYYHLQQPQTALKLFHRSLELEPAYGPARTWRIRLEAELNGRADPASEGA